MVVENFTGETLPDFVIIFFNKQEFPSQALTS